MSTTLRLSGYPAATPVSLTVAGINSVGTGAASAAKTATPGAAAGAAPSLWGDIAHGTVLSPAPLAVGTWQLDSASIAALSAASPYTSPQTVTEASTSIWGRVNASTDGTEQTFALTAATAYPFVAMLKAGTTAKARIVMRRPSNGLESRLLANTFSTAGLSTVVDAGAITGGAVELLADGFIRMSGVFTPDASGDYTFGVGPNGDGTVLLYGGALAELSGSAPDPDPEGVPAPFAPDQWELLDAGTDGATLIVRILALPASNPPLTFIGYRLNGSGASIGFPAIAPGDYQITVPSLAEASVLLRAANALGGVSSETKTATPTASSAPDPDGADFAVAANGYLQEHFAIDVGVPAAAKDPANSGTWGGEKPVNTTGFNELTHIAGNVLPSHGFGKSYVLGSGAIVYANAIGDLIFHPNGAYDNLNPGENALVTLTYRQSGDVTDKTVTIRVTGSTAVGPDLARGVTPSASMTLTQTVPAGEVLEVAFTASGSAVTPSLGGVAGAPCPAGRRDVQYIRSNGTAALTFAGGTVSNVIAKVVQTPGDAASIRKLTASRSGTTLSLAWDTSTRAGLPSTVGAVTSGPLTVTNGGTVRSIQNTPATDYFMDRVTMIDSGRLVRAGSLRNLTVLDCVRDGTSSTFSIREGASTLALGVGSQWNPVFLGPIHVQNLYSDHKIRTYPNMDNVNVTINGRSIRSLNNDTVDLDGPGDNLFTDPWNNDIRFVNIDSRNTGDAHFDCKAPAQIFACSMGEGALLGQTTKDGPSDGITYGGWRGIRNWRLTTTASRCYVARKARDVEFWLGSPYAFTQLWMYQIEANKVRAYQDITDVGFDVRGGYEFGWNSLWDGRLVPGYGGATTIAQVHHFIVKHTKPDLSPAADYAATDFEFEQSLNGGASWSPLAVERTGPNDCWGATRRTVTGVSTSITHVRARARWGAKVGAWTQVGVTT